MRATAGFRTVCMQYYCVGLFLAGSPLVRSVALVLRLVNLLLVYVPVSASVSAHSACDILFAIFASVAGTAEFLSSKTSMPCLHRSGKNGLNHQSRRPDAPRRKANLRCNRDVAKRSLPTKRRSNSWYRRSAVLRLSCGNIRCAASSVVYTAGQLSHHAALLS